MKNRKLLPALLLVLCLALSACGSAGLSSASGNKANGESFDFQAPQASAAPSEMPAPMPDAPGMADGSFSESGGGYYDNTKIIRTAELVLQTTDFDGAVAALDDLVLNRNKGYYESSDFSYGGYSGSGERQASFTVRVPKENFDAFLSAVGDVAHVVSRNTGVQDVGEAYYDAELRLSTLKTKHERLLTLLEKAELMEDIISLESALSDVEYEIQLYTSTLKRYDGLIDFSTISISLREVVRVSDTVTEVDPLSARLGSAFSRGWHSFCDGLADFALWCAYHFMGILIFLAAAAVVVVALLRLRKRRRKKYLPAVPPKETDKQDK